MRHTLLFLLALPAFAQQDNLQVSAPALVRPGTVLNITLRRTSNPQPPASAGTQVNFSFSGTVTALTIDSTPAGTVLAGCNLANGRCIVMSGSVMPDGIIGVVHATLGTNQNPNFTITSSSPISANAIGDNVSATVNPVVSVSVQNNCDINGDGQNTLADVQIAFDQALGKASAFPPADLNGDNVVDVRDVEWVRAATVQGGVCR